MNRYPGLPIDVGDWLELFVDDYLIAQMSGLERRLHRPVPQDVALVTDQPWEGNASGMVAVFQDEGLYRMFYRGLQFELEGEKDVRQPHPEFTCYAESEDGINWHRPELGLIEFQGSKKNNIIWNGGQHSCVHSLSPFKDTNPAADADARYKSWAIGANSGHDGPPKTPGAKGLFPMKSPDGIHWEFASDQPGITYGRFDSHNVCFWDEGRGEYRSYHRNFLERESYVAHEDAAPGAVRGTRAQRDMLTATSENFLDWSDSVYLTYERGKPDQLYTNSIIPYFRAPHILVGFPMRYVERPWGGAVEDLPELEHRRKRSDLSLRYGAALTDAMFMSSRDGRHFDLWPESFIRPGLRPQGNWTYADNLPNWGLVTTGSRFAGAPDEISLYTIEGYWRGNSLDLRRHTIRLDGFVSVQAPASGGELVTRPLVFSGGELTLNFSASAAGSVRVEILQDEEDLPLKGYTLDDCREVLGDDLERRVVWGENSDVSHLAGIPVRLRFQMRDADLYAFRFRPR